MSDRSEAQDHVWWIEASNSQTKLGKPRLAIAKSTSTDENTSYTYAESGKNVRVYGAVYDKTFISGDSSSTTEIGMNASPNIPSEYLEGLVHYAVMKGYEFKIKEDDRALQKSMYFKQYWDQCINMGKQSSNKDYLDNASYVIQPSDGFLF